MPFVGNVVVALNDESLAGGNQPRALSLAEIREGQAWREEVVITHALLESFIRISGDYASAHVDEDHATRMGFKGRIVHGFLSSLPFSRILGMFLPGSNSVIHKLELDLVAPTYVGDCLRYDVLVLRVVPAVRTVILSLSAANQRGELVSRGRATCTFRA